MIGFLASDSPWPVHNGGRARMAGLLSALGPDVRVLVATRHPGSEVDPRATALPASGRSRLGALAGSGPRLGRGLLGAASVAALREQSRDLDALVVSHSYLAAQLPDLGVPLVADLPNLEVVRQSGLGTLLGRVESWKARRWEPAVVRRAQLCLCVDEQDAAVVRRWGARAVVVVPNVVEVPASPASPAAGNVLLVADWRYGPNADGLRWFRSEVAPLLRSRVVLAGRGSEGLPGGVGFVDDLGPLYDAAAVVVSPVRRGAGTQLKVAEALSRGRLVVTTPYGGRSVPAAALPMGVELAEEAADFARAVDRVVREVEQRSARERALRTAPFARIWSEAAAPLVRALEGVARV